MFDLDAYLSRIGLSGRPSLADVHIAQATTIPFEGFDPHMGIAPRLGAEELVEKLVHRRRGGYCYEQNLLLKAALQALGYQVDHYLARVMIGLAPGAIRRPLTCCCAFAVVPRAVAGRAAQGAWLRSAAGTPMSASAAVRCSSRCHGGRGRSTSTRSSRQGTEPYVSTVAIRVLGPAGSG